LSKFFSGKKNNGLSYFDIMNTSFDLMRDKMVKHTLEHNPPDILIEISRHSCNIYDFYKADELIKIGKMATKKIIKTK
jgi:NTE family protein